MVAKADDWRRAGQEKFLLGVKLRWSDYRPYRDGWEHDHCEFCWQKFMASPAEGVETAGYTTDDSYRWICRTCFEDFEDEFQWKV